MLISYQSGIKDKHLLENSILYRHVDSESDEKFSELPVGPLSIDGLAIGKPFISAAGKRAQKMHHSGDRFANYVN